MSIDFERVKREYPCSTVVSRYVTIEKKHGRFWGLCPFHDDHKPTNFGVFMGNDGYERWYCFACHEGGDVIDFVAAIERCTKAEAVERITGDNMPRVGEFTPKPLAKSEASAWQPIIPVPLDAPPYKPELTYVPDSGKLKDWSRYERLDAYRDADGALICWVIRLRLSDGEKACPTVTFCEGPGGERKWAAKRMDPPYPLMGLDDLAAYRGRWVLIHEGERCKVEHDENCPEAENGGPKMLAVTWLGGAATVDKVDWSPLYGRCWYTSPDDDEPGRRAMKRVHEILTENAVEKAGTGVAR
jgi:hypothetical protein